MTVVTLSSAERDLEDAFEHYHAIRPELGDDFLAEFRRAVDRILTHPNAWPQMDQTYRRSRFHRFPYGVMYRVDEPTQQIVVTSVMHLHRKPQDWYR